MDLGKQIEETEPATKGGERTGKRERSTIDALTEFNEVYADFLKNASLALEYINEINKSLKEAVDLYKSKRD